MSETSQLYGEHSLSTAWLPLEGRCESWATLAYEAHTTDLLQVVGLAFQAFSCEQEAHTHYEQAHQHPSLSGRITTLDRATEALSQARQCWSDVLSTLEYQAINLHISPSNRQLARTLLPRVWDERLRMTALLLQVEQTQAHCQRDYDVAGEHRSKDE